MKRPWFSLEKGNPYFVKIRTLKVWFKSWLKAWHVALFLVVTVGGLSNLGNVHEADNQGLGIRSLRALDPYLPVHSVKVEVGTQKLPPLSHWLILDPGLSEDFWKETRRSFQGMKTETLGASIADFQLQLQVLSSVQRAPEVQVSDQIRMQDLLTAMRRPASLSNSEWENFRLPKNLGRNFGDRLGYQVSKENNIYNINLAPVVSREPSSDSSRVSRETFSSVLKNSQEAVEIFLNRTQKRVEILAAGAPQNPSLNQDLLEASSGLCAMARILADPAVPASEARSSFFLASGRDDSDPLGSQCVQSYQFSDGETKLRDGVCESRRTLFSFETESARKAQCVFQYRDESQFKIVAEVPRWNSSASFFQISHFNCEETDLRFLEVSQWKKKMTRAKVRFQQAGASTQEKEIWLPGLITGESCQSQVAENLPAGSHIVSADCQSESIQIPSQSPPIGSCSYADKNCEVAGTSKRRFVFPGDYLANCSLQALSRSQNIVPGTIQCQLTGQIRTSNQPLSLCRAVIATSKDFKTDLNEDLRRPEDCRRKVISLGGYVDENYPAVCTSKLETSLQRQEGTLELKSFRWPDKRERASEEMDCPLEVKNEIARERQILPETLATCRISPGSLKKTTEDLLEDSCHRQTFRFCRAHPSYRDCGLKMELAEGRGRQIKSLAADEDLTCESLCRDSKTNFCQGKPANSSWSSETIADYLKGKQGMISSCESRRLVTREISRFFGKSEAELEKVCALNAPGASTGSKTPPVYTRIKNEYFYKGYFPIFVAGNKVKDGRLMPEKNLSEFIRDRLEQTTGSERTLLHLALQREISPTYMNFAQPLAGLMEPLLNFDFASALQQDLISAAAEARRYYPLTELQPLQKVFEVKWRKKGQTMAQVVDEKLWWQSSSGVQFHASLAFELGDELEFLYQ